MSFQRYLALGDSISIDLYPALDRAHTSSGSRDLDLRRGFGAASLFFFNQAFEWPEFEQRDLGTRYPGIAFRNHHHFSYPQQYPTDNYTTDGATTSTVLEQQVRRVEASGEDTIATLTVGGNDLLQAMQTAEGAPNPVRGMLDRLARIIEMLRERRPRLTLLLGTVYDPSDGTNDLGAGRLDREAAWLAEYNTAVRAMAARQGGTRIADIHRHFLGHGITAPPGQRWYWRGLIFEPNARGASEVRRVWLDALAL